jgi:hypothetical protein
LGFEILEDHHTSILLASIVWDTLDEYNILDKLFCITTDNASNNITMVNQLGHMFSDIDIEWDPSKHHIRCLAHVINLVVSEFLKKLQVNSDGICFTSTVTKIRSIAKAIRSSTLRWEAFQRCCQHFGIKPMTIPLDVTVRWNSTFRMLEQSVYLRNPIRRLVDDYPTELGPHRLTDDEWDLAEILLVFLMPFQRCTTRFESNNSSPEIDYVFFVYDTMYNHIEDVQTALQSNAGIGVLRYAPYMSAALDAMIKELNIYYTMTKFPSVYGDAMLLNPRCKLSLFDEETWQDVDPDTYIKPCRHRFLTYYDTVPQSSGTGVLSSSTAPSSSVSSTPSSSTTHLSTSTKRSAHRDDAEFAALLDKRGGKRRRNDWDRYIEVPNDPNISSVLEWWKINKALYPALAKMARDVLAVPASGCAVEREFSVSGRIATWQRNRLNATTIRDSMIYKNALKRNRIPLRSVDGVVVDEDFPVPEEQGIVPAEWSEQWWLETLKPWRPVNPHIVGMFTNQKGEKAAKE